MPHYPPNARHNSVPSGGRSIPRTNPIIKIVFDVCHTFTKRPMTADELLQKSIEEVAATLKTLQTVQENIVKAGLVTHEELVRLFDSHAEISQNINDVSDAKLIMDKKQFDWEYRNSLKNIRQSTKSWSMETERVSNNFTFAVIETKDRRSRENYAAKVAAESANTGTFADPFADASESSITQPGRITLHRRKGPDLAQPPL